MIKHKLIVGDVYAGLDFLEDNSIDIAITSPPYWNQRDYGIEDQIGSEETYYLYIKRLDTIFQLLKQKMKYDGVFFLNIGDKYLSKYGKSPLGFIPYKLADEMIKSGWYLCDIIIWFKPNHMPSSIKNRFINSYEPVFVFSPSEKNIFTEKKNLDNNYSNILKVNLQPTSYKHVAVFPEKLVKSLIMKVKFKKNMKILDPFAGSGTTLKVIQDMNLDASGIMIEKNMNYVEIIKNRCKLNGDYSLIKPDYIKYFSADESESNTQLEFFSDHHQQMFNDNLKRGRLTITKSMDEYYKMLKKFIDHSIKFKYSVDSIFLIGSREFDLDLILSTASLNQRGWVIRNMIVVEEKNCWYPIFLVVDDNKRYNYVFNYQKLNIKSKSEYSRDWSITNFIGYRVLDSINKTRRKGKVIDILEKLDNSFPVYVVVQWSNNETTKEYIIHDEKIIEDNILISKTDDSILVKENKNLIELDKIWTNSSDRGEYLYHKKNIKNYNGKFTNEKRINLGASPGARASVDEEYFSLQRLYNIDQNLVSDYINLKRIEKGLSKSELTSLFHESYRHTVGHWLRKDFGGSIPTPEDWFKLSKILDFDKSFTNYVCKTALKLQTVKHAEKKPPRDFIEDSFVKKLKLLYKN